MRTTVTLTPEAQALVERVMRERGRSFKEVVNDAILRALGDPDPAPYRMPTFDLGLSEYEITHARDVLAEDDADRLERIEQAGRSGA